MTRPSSLGLLPSSDQVDRLLATLRQMRLLGVVLSQPLQPRLDLTTRRPLNRVNYSAR